ncbi:hypothetical protein [Streptomyces sp. NPDC088755]|uniref:hypothetical protein n=1 Tax=Streptomyces sp. NPDC088755 TaxID=3365888 RepID=UPI003813A459
MSLLVFAALGPAILAGLMMRRSVRSRWYEQPIELIGAALAVGVCAVVVWGIGIFAGGLDSRESCQLTHHTTYDQAWRERTGANGTSVFPLANACNEHVSLVPAWVNPTIAVLAAFTVSALALALFRIALAIFHRKEPVSS